MVRNSNRSAEKSRKMQGISVHAEVMFTPPKNCVDACDSCSGKVSISDRNNHKLATKSR